MQLCKDRLSVVLLIFIASTVNCRAFDYAKKWAEFKEDFAVTTNSNLDKFFDDDANSKEESFNGPLSVAHKSYTSLVVNGPARLSSVSIKKDLTVRGPLDARDLTAKLVTVYGPASIDSGTVDAFIIHGPLSLKNITTQTVEVNGSFSATDTTIKKLAKINGTVSTAGSTFEKLLINSSRAALSKSTVDSITIVSSRKTPELSLDDTAIKNTITFEGRRGKVYLSGTSKKINKSQIKNGDIIADKSDSQELFVTKQPFNSKKTEPATKESDNKNLINKVTSVVVIDGKTIELQAGQTLTLKDGQVSITA